MPLVRIPHPKATYDLPEAPDIRRSIGEQIKAKRLAFEMSQLELAQTLGKKSAAYVAFIESGDRNITAAELVRLAKHFRVSLSYFYK